MRNEPVGDWRFPSFRLSSYNESVKGGWTDNEIERFILRDLPRTVHGLNGERQIEDLERGVEQTNVEQEGGTARTVWGCPCIR